MGSYNICMVKNITPYSLSLLLAFIDCFIESFYTRNTKTVIDVAKKKKKKKGENQIENLKDKYFISKYYCN